MKTERWKKGEVKKDRGDDERGTRGQEPKEDGAHAEALCTLYTRECMPDKTAQTLYSTIVCAEYENNGKKIISSRCSVVGR